MLPLDSPRWSRLTHAYGSASDVPHWLTQLSSLPTSEGQNEPWYSIWSALAHQGDVYEASYAESGVLYAKVKYARPQQRVLRNFYDQH